MIILWINEMCIRDRIRVVLMTNGYQGIIHKEVKLRADSELTCLLYTSDPIDPIEIPYLQEMKKKRTI